MPASSLNMRRPGEVVLCPSFSSYKMRVVTVPHPRIAVGLNELIFVKHLQCCLLNDGEGAVSSCVCVCGLLAS